MKEDLCMKVLSLYKINRPGGIKLLGLRAQRTSIVVQEGTLPTSWHPAVRIRFVSFFFGASRVCYIPSKFINTMSHTFERDLK